MSHSQDLDKELSETYKRDRHEDDSGIHVRD